MTICVAKEYPFPGRSFFRRERKALTDFMKRYSPDIVNAQWSYEFALAALDSRIPTIVTVRDHSLTIFWYFLTIFFVLRQSGYPE